MTIIFLLQRYRKKLKSQKSGTVRLAKTGKSGTVSSHISLGRSLIANANSHALPAGLLCIKNLKNDIFILFCA